MYPFVALPLIEIVVPTALLLLFVVFGLGLLSFIILLRPGLNWFFSTNFYVITLMAAIFGGRLFHVVWEKPSYFIEKPGEIFTRYDGMVFYGGILGGIGAILLLNRFFVPQMHRNRVWDIAAVLTAFGYGLLRLGCFLNGCCWGKITAVPWAVQYYNPRGLMPYLGVPVHPVQIYDALVGATLGVLLLVFLLRENCKGRLALLFFALYGLTRICTEQFRGDSFRGSDVILGLSTSQFLSVIILILIGVFYLISTLHLLRIRYVEN